MRKLQHITQVLHAYTINTLYLLSSRAMLYILLHTHISSHLISISHSHFRSQASKSIARTIQHQPSRASTSQPTSRASTSQHHACSNQSNPTRGKPTTDLIPPATVEIPAKHIDRKHSVEPGSSDMEASSSITQHSPTSGASVLVPIPELNTSPIAPSDRSIRRIQSVERQSRATAEPILTQRRHPSSSPSHHLLASLRADVSHSSERECRSVFSKEGLTT